MFLRQKGGAKERDKLAFPSIHKTLKASSYARLAANEIGAHAAIAAGQKTLWQEKKKTTSAGSCCNN